MSAPSTSALDREHRTGHIDDADAVERTRVAARQSCDQRGLGGELSLVRHGRRCTIWKLDDPVHGRLAVRVENDVSSAFRSKTVRATRLLMDAGVDVVPLFDDTITFHHDAHGSLSVAVWHWIDGTHVTLAEVDPYAAGKLLADIHRVSGDGLSSVRGQNRLLYRERWRLMMTRAKAAPDHPLRDKTLATALSKQFRIGQLNAFGYLDSMTRLHLPSAERTKMIHGDWNGNLIVGIHPLTGRRSVMVNDLEYAGCGARHFDNWMGIAAVLWNGLPTDGYRAFIEGYGLNAPPPLELIPFGVLWTFNRLMHAAECIASGRETEDPRSWDELVSIALTDPFGDPKWRDMCGELSKGGPPARFPVPDEWPLARPLLGNPKRLSYLTGR